jgi:hypothetical protein
VPFRSFRCPNFKTEVTIRKRIPEGIHRRSSEKVQRLGNLAGNLGRQAESVCVTWSIFELKNTSGVNYIFILERSSVATLYGYGSNDERLWISNCERMQEDIGNGMEVKCG